MPRASLANSVRPRRRCPRFRLAIVLSLAVALSPWWSVCRAAGDAADALPPNLNRSLRQLVVWHRSQSHTLAATERRSRLAKSLPARVNRVQLNEAATTAVVDATLDGKVPLATVRDSLTRLGAEVFAEYDAGRAGSILSLHLPLDLAEAAAQLPGVWSLSLVHQAWRHLGRVTSQGADVLKAKAVKETLGFDGTGITVGVLSDSYDKLYTNSNNPYYNGNDPSTITATRAIANGDLPGPGNPLGHTQAVQVIQDSTGSGLDEGRAMLEIVHDLAPGAQLVFHNAGLTPADLAQGIKRLRSGSYINSVYCDVIVDDFGFPDEPMFSDGPAAQAAKLVATSLLLPGHPVVYVSSAGNNGDVAYDADFAPVTYQAALASGKGMGNLKLDQVPANLLAGGLHNFNPAPGKVTLAQKVKLRGDAEISFQWDDPFTPGKITSDYDLLVFDADGNYQPGLSGTDDNFKMGKALEVLDFSLPDGQTSVTYQFAISRRGTLTGQAKHLRYVVNGGDATIKFLGYNHPTTFGHNAGPGVIGVAAYAYDKLAHPEWYSSLGPATIYFDANNQRLAVPEVRQQPAVAAVDGVDTSFFPPGLLKLKDGSPGTDSDGDGFPNFFGTSAAAPHVAAVAALLLQAAGGPGSLTPAQVLTLLQSTAADHDLSPNFATATLAPDAASTVTLSAIGDESTTSSGDKNGFHLTYDGPPGQYLRKVVIDLGSTGLKFDPSDNGLPFTVGAKVGLAATDVTSTLDEAASTLTLNFVPGAFVAGRSLSFGIDRDLAETDTDGNSADLLAGAAVTVRTKGAAGAGKARGTLASPVGSGYGPNAGFGLVNATAAVRSLLAHPPSQGKPLPLSSGDLLLACSNSLLIETKRDGTVMGQFQVPSPVQNAAATSVGEPRGAVVDGNGNVVVLNKVSPTYLTTINAQTGSATSVTAPGWDAGNLGSGDIVAIGHYIFTPYAQRDYLSPLGLLLRFDTNSGEFRAFGSSSGVAFRGYHSLAKGPDGLLYGVLAYPDSTDGVQVDVYDPETMTVVRSVSLHYVERNLTLVFRPDERSSGTLAIGPGGEIYTLGTGVGSTVFKFDANGNQLAYLSLPVTVTPAGFRVYDLRFDGQGQFVVGSADPVLINSTLQATTTFALDLESRDPYGTTPAVTAEFIP